MSKWDLGLLALATCFASLIIRGWIEYAPSSAGAAGLPVAVPVEVPDNGRQATGSSS